MAFTVKELSITLTSEEGHVWVVAHGCGVSVMAKTCEHTQVACSPNPVGEDLDKLLSALKESVKGFETAANVAGKSKG